MFIKDVLETELKKNNIPYERERPFNILYEDIILLHSFNADFLVYDSIILEIKAASQIHPANFKQTINYLKASQIKSGVLINFGEEKQNSRE